jgi:GT2 family glycosyltransferase
MKQSIKKITVQILRFHVAISTLILIKLPKLSRLLKTEILRKAEDFEFISESFDSLSVSGLPAGDTPIDWQQSAVAKEFLINSSKSEIRKISIIVPSFNGEQHIQRLLTSFLRHNTYESYEFIFVTQGSDDGTLEALRLYSNDINICVVENSFNDTFTNASNLGAENASGDFLIFCNNDVEFISDALTHIAENFTINNVGIWGVRQVSKNRILGTEKSWHNGIGFFRDPKSGSLQPRNIPDVSHSGPSLGVFRAWAVNGGFLAMRKQDFQSLGGFGREFEYGYEDVDLCIRCWRDLKKEVFIDARITLLHNESSTRVKLASEISTTRELKNTAALKSSVGNYIEEESHLNRTAREPKLDSLPNVKIAFLVSSTPEEELGHGDPLVAATLGKWLARVGSWRYSLVSPEDWYGPLYDFDVVLSMRPDIDLGRLSLKPQATLVTWMRNRLDEWIAHKDLQIVSLHLSSSKLAKEVFERETSLPSSVLRIAADTELFGDLLSEGPRPVDVLLSENYWGHKRDIHDWSPDTRKYSLEVLGRGWGQAGAPSKLTKHWKGFVGYQNLGFAYSKAKIVIDDATSATKPWAMTNMRVYEATASGCLVLSNCKDGVEELFGNSFPTWDGPEELSAIIDRYLNDESLRHSEISRAREHILLNHTYELRAQEFISLHDSRVHY